MTPKTVEDICTAMISNFEKPFDEQFTQSDFLFAFSSDIEWIDHAFHVRRQGHAAVLGLRTSWLHCNQPFRSKINAVHPITGGAVVELVWIGCCKNDIVRPDGEMVVEGTGKDYENHVCFIMEINHRGKITRINEYYNRRWDQGTGAGRYLVMTGESMKI